MSMQEFEFDADFLRWLGSQDPRFLDFMFRYFRELTQLQQAGVNPTLPAPPTGKHLKVRFFRNKAEFDAAQSAFEREANTRSLISDDEIKALQQHLDRNFGGGPPEG